MKNFLRNPVVLSSLGAVILILFGLLMPGRVGIALSAYAPTNTPVPAPTATQVPSPPSADEVSERARGISRPGIDTSGGGSNTIGATVFLYNAPLAGTLAGSVEIYVPINGVNVQLAFFGPNLVATPPQTINGTNSAAGWRTVISASSKGSNWRNIQIFNASNTLVANFDIKIS